MREPARGLRAWMAFGPVLLAMAWGMPLANAANLPEPARSEIGALLSRLEGSGCSFIRNGTGYSAAEARAHLDRKLRYLVNRSAVASAEQFIDRAASESSLSGQPYWVRCEGSLPVQSHTWLQGELRALRAQPAMPVAPTPPAH